MMAIWTMRFLSQKTHSQNYKQLKNRIMKTENYTRDEIIAALRRFDESSIGDILDNVSTEELYERLNQVSEVFTADDLILAAILGF